ncbi:pyridoxamine 5'-phosphate oxidase family protein [Flavitalea sp.]|nr:pyridoxamine 5'-phosphate oxidase family protein [Flavitalea sp.]
MEKIQDIARDADICLFATNLTRLPISARPMSTQKVDDQGNLWFLSSKSSVHNEDIGKDGRVQLFYTHKGSSEYLSVYGEATILVDREIAKELWSPIVKAWFPEGVDDPELTIIKVVPSDAYYWDTKNNKTVSLLKIIAGAVTGKTMDDGVKGKISV